jgi:RimJ/RimL family protein N-acetyltransferase
VSTVPPLDTERLVMRGFRDDDQERWAAIRADDEVMRSLGRDGGIAPDEAWREMAMLAGHWALKGFGHWALEERSSGALIGNAGLFFPPDWPALEVGWTVARPRWGEGFAGEAARAAARWAQAQLGTGHLISLIAPSNSRSLRVAEKLGMTHEGEAHVRGFRLLKYGSDLPLADADSGERGAGTGGP